jgi:8-oxo-dGTP pyrophosphatase MutT (NUDIX family)
MGIAVAATAVVLRDGDAGLECLMLHKTRGQAFGDAWVFPGGRVEPEDGEGAEGLRRTAVRETEEETGLRLDAEWLVPFSHWVPPLDAPRRYSTWFFLVPLPTGIDPADVRTDGGEIADHRWTAPTEALEAQRRGELQLLPPTWLTLHQLSSHDDVAATLQAAVGRPVERFSTRMVSDGGEGGDMLVALWPPDAAYPDGETEPPRPLDTSGPRHRLYMDPSGWRYERS